MDMEAGDMLNERELHALRKIERQLGADIKFAAAMSRGLSNRRDVWMRRGYDITMALALVLAAACFALAAAGTVGAGAVAALLAAVTCYLRWRRFGRGGRGFCLPMSASRSRP
jgi:hypothetical protein